MISAVVVTVLVVALLFVVISPLESLRWWSRQDAVQARDLLALPARRDVPAAPTHDHFVVYLSGIGVLDGSRNSKRELAVLAGVAEALPRVEVVADVFPYAVENRGLLQRTTTWLWKRLDTGRRKKRISVVHYLINVRNFLQMLVSADPRYGPTYNLALAQEILQGLVRHGWDDAHPAPVTIIGYSGGAQIATGAAWYLGARGVNVSIISVGGVFADDPGLEHVKAFRHLYGSNDTLQHLGAALFPGRWRTAPLSAYGRAVREGRLTKQCIGPMTHDGKRSYFDARAIADDGRTYSEITRDAIIETLRVQGVALENPRPGE